MILNAFSFFSTTIYFHYEVSGIAKERNFILVKLQGENISLMLHNKLRIKKSP